jgi:hypothetical protein
MRKAEKLDCVIQHETRDMAIYALVCRHGNMDITLLELAELDRISFSLPESRRQKVSVIHGIIKYIS